MHRRRSMAATRWNAAANRLGTRGFHPWIAPARWGEGLATNALNAFFDVETTRPLLARVAEQNVGSATVLVRAGFVVIGSETAYAAGVGREVVEHIYRLGR